ncbi:MAG: hypothetical protein AAGA03_08520, partial [Planctomycetota bacterium]
MSQTPNNPFANPSNPYAAATTPNPVGPGSTPPQVILWQKVYLIFMVLLYLTVAGVGAFLFFGADMVAAGDD